MRAIADSGAIYALYDRDDANHKQVLNILKKGRYTLILPVAILAEIDYLLLENLGFNAELDFVDAILEGTFLLEALTETDVRRCRELLNTYKDLELGLADCAVVATAERLNISSIFTVDQKHFRAVRPKSGAFKLLPMDA